MAHSETPTLPEPALTRLESALTRPAPATTAGARSSEALTRTLAQTLTLTDRPRIPLETTPMTEYSTTRRAAA